MGGGVKKVRLARAFEALDASGQPEIIKSLFFALDTSSMTSYLADNWYWMVAAAASGGALLWLQLKEGVGAGISPQEAVMLINREKAIVVDVSDAATFAQGHVNGSKNIALDKLEGAKGLPGKKQTAIVVVSSNGSEATKGAAVLKAQGYENVQVLGGGLKAWAAANLPVNKPE
jgi:rhodanese-related sulfurtransferase